MSETNSINESEKNLEEEPLNEEEAIFNEILEINKRRFECEQNGDYIEAGRLKQFLHELGSLYQAKCISNLDENHRYFN